MHWRDISDLIKRVFEHNNGPVDGFTKKYGVHFLVWHEIHQSAENAFTREKQIKKWNRTWKRELEKGNPDWHDLYCDLASEPGFPLPRE